MSRNRKLRDVADKLPPMPKILNGRIQRDSRGRALEVDHFEEMRALRDRAPSKEAGKMAQHAYTVGVMTWENERLRRIRKRNQKAIAVIAALFITAFLIIIFK